MRLNDRQFWAVFALAVLGWWGVVAYAASDFGKVPTQKIWIQDDADEGCIEFYELSADITAGTFDSSICMAQTTKKPSWYTFTTAASAGQEVFEIEGYDSVQGAASYIVGQANPAKIVFPELAEFQLSFTGIGGFHTGTQRQEVAAAVTGLEMTNTSDSTTANWRIYGDGDMAWGTLAAGLDVNLYRSAADTLKTDDSFEVGANLIVGATAWTSATHAHTAASSGGTITEASISDLSHTSSEYYQAIWAEENAALGASNTYEWAMGNGAALASTEGLTLYVPSGWSAEVEAMSLTLGTTSTANVELVINGTPQGALADVTVTSATQGTNSGFTAVAVSTGDLINFRTVSSSGTASANVVTVWVRYYK